MVSTSARWIPSATALRYWGILPFLKSILTSGIVSPGNFMALDVAARAAIREACSSRDGIGLAHANRECRRCYLLITEDREEAAAKVIARARRLPKRKLLAADLERRFA